MNYRSMYGLFLAVVIFTIFPVAAYAMQIFVQPPKSADLLTLEVEPSDSIENIKAKIQDQLDYAPDEQRLVYNNGRLEDGRTLSDYNIQRDEIIDFVLLTDGVANFVFTITNTSGGSCTWANYLSSCTFQEVSSFAKSIYFDNYTINDERRNNSSSTTSVAQRVKNLIEMGNIEAAEKLKQEWPNLFPKNSDYNPRIILTIKPDVRDLKLNMKGDDVKKLQVLLNSQGFVLTDSGAGSLGNETGFFGILTQKALSKYQQKNGIFPPNGYFGPITRTQMKNVGLEGLWW